MAIIPALVAPLQAALLQEPLAFLAAEHARQTVLLAHLERLARAPEGRASRLLARVLLHWLSVELPLHLADEEASLYPRLAAFDSEGVLPRLREQRRQDRLATPALLAALRRAAGGEPPAAGFTEAALGFVARQRQQLALEESALVPLAQRQLGAAELSAVAAEMIQRRG